MQNPRHLLVKALDKYAPELMLSARYKWHVEHKGSVGYPNVLKPLFNRMGAHKLRAADVGANVGIYARFLSRNFRHCDAFEPLPMLVSALRRASDRNCTIHSGAVGEIDGSITLHIPLNSNGEMMHALTSAATSNDFGLFEHTGINKIVAPVMRLDTVLGDANDLAFIKIDVEGFELSVINGAKLIISRQRPIFLIEICKAHNSDYKGLLNLMKAANYAMFALYDDRLDVGTISQIEAQPLTLTPLQLKSARKYVWDFLFVPEEKCMNLVGLL